MQNKRVFPSLFSEFFIHLVFMYTLSYLATLIPRKEEVTRGLDINLNHV